MVGDGLAQFPETWVMCRKLNTRNLLKVTSGTPGDRPPRQLSALSQAAWEYDGHVIPAPSKQEVSSGGSQSQDGWLVPSLDLMPE